MKYLLITITLILFACNSKDNYNYRITKTLAGGRKAAIFYTDTIEFNGDSIGYHNTDGSYVFISDSLGLDCFIDTLK